MIDTSKQWNLKREIIYDDGTDWGRLYDYTIINKLIGDSIINGKHYQILQERNATSALDTWSPTYLYREEIDSQKVYILSDFSGELSEELIFDFSLNKGDSIIIGWHTIIIDSIRYVDFAGKLRKIQYTHCKTPDGEGLIFSGFKLIEGVGTLNGLYDQYECLHDRMGNCPRDFLICYSENGETLFQDGDSCYVYKNYTGIEEKESGHELKIYPNPAIDQITIQTSNSIRKAYIRLYSIDGRLIVSKDLYNEKETISIRSLSNGIYFVSIYLNKSFIMNKKILIYH